jgi:hypothetical protein
MHGILTKMKTTEEIIDLIAWRIGLLYHHNPLMYGGTPEGVENLLFHYHLLWAEIVDRVKEHSDVKGQVYEEEECNGHGFVGRYLVLHPDAKAGEVLQYLVSQWRKISDRLGIPIPHKAIIEDLRKDFGSRKWF